MDQVFPTRITALKLTSFRNYKSLNLDLEPKSVVLAGPNGSGKTNLLEAVSYLSPGRGLRRAQYVDVGLTPEKGGDGLWAVATSLETENGDTEIGTGLSMQDGVPDKSRRIRIDRQQVKSGDALTEYVRVLWLTPAMDGLFTGPAGDRRRFLDRLVLALDPTHGRRVNDFDKAVRNRNKVLEEAFDNSSWLDAAEMQIAELGTAITAARHEILALLSTEVEKSSAMTEHFPQALLELEGSVDDLVRTHLATDAEDAYRSLLQQSRRRDRAAGRTLEGPHRSDLLVRHAEKDMAARLCSTGEQKALLIGIVLAHAKLVGTIAGMAPIVLLDEVAAHLDQFRRAALFDVLEALNCQAFMTGTDRDLFADLGDRAQFLHVENGTIS
ncbi:MAG: DNA replication/repair protein RecF [Hyphomicrobiales bacterium]